MISKEKQPIPESLKKVLLEIAKKGPQTKYEIEKNTKVNHASVHQAVKKLLGAGVVEGEKIGTTRIGLPKIKYKLTFLGLCWAIRFADYKDYDKIIHNWGHLEPTLFGRWNYLKGRVGREEAEEFFARGVRDIGIASDPEELKEEFRNEAVRELFEWYKDNIYETDSEFEKEYGQVYGHKFREAFEKWIEALDSDSELGKYAMKYAVETIEFAQKELRWARSIWTKLSKTDRSSL